MSIEPEDVEASAGPEVFLDPYIVPEDVAVVVLTMAALAVVSYIEGAGAAVKQHIACVLLESRFGVVVADDEFRMRLYLSCVYSPGIAAKALGRCLNTLGVNIVD